MATYLEMPEELIEPNGGSKWEVVYDPSVVYRWLKPVRVVGLMPKRKRRRRPKRSSIPDLLNAIVDHDREAIYVAMLTKQQRVFAVYVLGIGGPNATTVDRTTLLRSVLLANPDGGVVLIHNHPSGRKRPSTDDAHLTKSASELLGRFGYKLVDHLVIARDGVFSFEQAGMVG